MRIVVILHILQVHCIVTTILVSGYQNTKFIILSVDTYHRIGTPVIHAKNFAYMQCTQICVFAATKDLLMSTMFHN